MGAAVKILESLRGLGCQLSLEDRTFYYGMGWVYVSVLIEKSCLWRWSKKDWRAERLCGSSFFQWWGEVLLYFCQCFEKCHQLSRTVSKFWKMAHWRVIEREHLACSSHLETLLLLPTPDSWYFTSSQVCEKGGTKPDLEGDCWRLPLAWAHGQLPEQGVSGAASDHPACSAAPGYWHFQPQAARDPILMRSPEPVVCVTAHAAFSYYTRRKDFALTEILCRHRGQNLRPDRLSDMWEQSNQTSHTGQAHRCLSCEWMFRHVVNLEGELRLP